MEKAHQTHNVYEDTLRVPFIVRWPGQVRANHVSHDLVELVDLYPTLLSMIGAPPPQGVTLPGQSLLPHLQDGSPVRRKVAFSENWVMLSAIGHDHKLGAWIERPGDFPDMLFDRRRDPLETHNAVEEQPEAAAELTEAMSHFVGATPNDSGKPLAPERLA
jgi:arylsulfatase A-like enzyme